MCAGGRLFARVAAIAALLFVAEGVFAQGTQEKVTAKDAAKPSAKDGAKQSAQSEAKNDAKSGAKAGANVITLDLGKDVKMELVVIRPGSFTMGDDKGNDDEKPAHKVAITKAFCIGKYKVTQKQWEAVMGSNPSTFKRPTNPVENVSWEDCQAFLKKLDEIFADTGKKFSLPTEAQWEYASRAGSSTSYYFGNDRAILGQYAWFIGNSEGKTHTVGQKKPNAWGLYDVQGNVWEWCADWYQKGYYKTSAADDPTGPSTGSFRICRGSSWGSPASDCRSAFRLFDAPSDRFSYLGLRVVCSP
jgi:formylglycine-generating enzyme required for sulfatase activity